jgi:hypothetical protein
LLQKKRLLDDERIVLLTSFRHSGFSVDATPTVWPSDGAGSNGSAATSCAVPSPCSESTGPRARKLSSMRQRLLTTTPSPRTPRVRLSISSSFSPASSLRSPSLENMDLTTSAPIPPEPGRSTNHKTRSSEPWLP